VKLRPTSARIARQAEGILTTLDTAGQTPFRSSKRNIANGSPGYNQRAVNRYAEENKENIPKRRKVVKFEDEQQDDNKENSNNGLERIVLDLQRQVQRLQRDHSTAISSMQEKLEAQSRQIDKLLKERR
jgi:phage host-nuclease inhibitor protein Gam